MKYQKGLPFLFSFFFASIYFYEWILLIFLRIGYIRIFCQYLFLQISNFGIFAKFYFLEKGQNLENSQKVIAFR